MTTHFVMMGVCGCGKPLPHCLYKNISTNARMPKAMISIRKPTATRWVPVFR